VGVLLLVFLCYSTADKSGWLQTAGCHWAVLGTVVVVSYCLLRRRKLSVLSSNTIESIILHLQECYWLN